MSEKYIDGFARFASTAMEKPLPSIVLDESKRIILDSIGCALAGIDSQSGNIGVEYGRMLGGPSGPAQIIGTRHVTSSVGAAFANAELIQALDFDPVALPGHVAPYTVPVALSLGQVEGVSGRNVITAVAVAHEISYRLAQAMDRNRDTKDGKADTSPVLGYSSTVFGATSAASVVLGQSFVDTANALGIAGSTSPVNGHRSWLMHAPPSTIKNSLLPGGVAFAGITSAYMASLGHRGDRQLLDDEEFGYPRYIGTRRWEPEKLTDELGEIWHFPQASAFKPYPHFRVPHALFDAARELIRENDIQPADIDCIRAWGEEWASQFPTFRNTTIERPFDAQFSYKHGLALAAHLEYGPGKRWQDEDVVYDPSVMRLMERIIWKPHQGWAEAVARDPSARPARIEIVVGANTYVAEREYPHGSPSPDPSTYMSTAELVEKFRRNAEGVITAGATDELLDMLLKLEEVESMRPVLERTAVASA